MPAEAARPTDLDISRCYIQRLRYVRAKSLRKADLTLTKSLTASGHGVLGCVAAVTLLRAALKKRGDALARAEVSWQ